jgi:hypothetical protein
MHLRSRTRVCARGQSPYCSCSRLHRIEILTIKLYTTPDRCRVLAAFIIL